MSKIDIRLLYQKDSGESLDNINSEHSADFNPYIIWLEERLEEALNAGNKLQEANLNHHIARWK